MYKKHEANKKPNRSGKTVALLASVALLVCATIIVALAYLFTESEPLINTFIAAKVTTEVDETLENAKKDVKIKNTGNVDAWIRAYVVVTWEDPDGNVYGKAPVAGTDYSIEYAENTGWMKGDDDFWYYTRPVSPNEATNVLINTCEYTANAPEGYSLNVEIIGSGIQSEPGSVFTGFWSSSGLTVSDITLVSNDADAGGIQ